MKLKLLCGLVLQLVLCQPDGRLAAANRDEMPLGDSYSIAEIASDIGADAEIGRVRAGFACLPKGLLRWGELKHRSAIDMVRSASESLSQHGLNIVHPTDALFGEAQRPTRYRVRIVFENANLKLCVAGLGIGERNPALTGFIAVRWETYDSETRQLSSTARYSISFAKAQSDPRATDAVVVRAINDSAVLYAQARSK